MTVNTCKRYQHRNCSL